MRPMLYKELLSVWPQLLVVFVVEATLLFSDLAGTDGLRGLAPLITEDTDGLMMFMGCLAFALGHGQIGPEISHRHVELLDGLPVTRTQMYLAKVLAGLVVLILLVTVTTTGKVAMAQLMWGASAPKTLGIISATIAAALFSFYGTGLLLSWFGGFGWALLGLGVTVISMFAELVEPLRPLSVFHGYGNVRFEVNEPLVVLWPMVAWAGYGAVCMLGSGALFIGRGDRLVDASSGLARTARATLVMVFSGLLVLMGTVTLSRLSGRGSASQERPTVVEAGSYRVSIPPSVEDKARVLVERIPELDRAVRDLLGATEPLQLDVELTGGGRYHAGRYTGGKIRMSLDGDSAHIFAHELAHAYVDKLTAGRFMRHHNAVRFFNEGLATWVAEEVTQGRTDQTIGFRVWAGAIYSLGHHSIDLLLNDADRKRRYDPFEPYPLGLVFVEALELLAGPEGLRCVLKAAAELPDGPMSEVALWSQLLEQCDIQMAKLSNKYEEFLALYDEAWPVPSKPPVAAPIWVDGRLMLEWPAPEASDASIESPPQLRCRFRSRIAAPAADLDESRVGPSGHRCPVKAVISATEIVSYQVGVELEKAWVVYGPWIEQPLP